jgi:hypothetical protein
MKRNGGPWELVLHVECSPAPMFHPRISIAHQPRTLRCTPAGIGCTPRIERRAGIRCGSPQAADSVLRPGRLAIAGGRRRSWRVAALGPGCAAHGPGACGATPPTQSRRAAPDHQVPIEQRGSISTTSGRDAMDVTARRLAGVRRGEGVGGLIFKLSFDRRPWPTPAQKFPGFELFLWTTE